MYFQGKLIGSRRDWHSTASTAFDAEIFAIVKALQLLQARLQTSSSSNQIPFDKVILYSDSSLSLKLLEKNPSSFLHHPAYIQVFKLVTHILSTFPSISISLNWCPAHKGVIGNEEADRLASEAAALLIPNSTSITASFCALVSTKELLEGCTYY